MPLPIPDGLYYIFTYAGQENVYALDVPIGDPDISYDDGTPIQVYQWNRGDNQQWRFTRIQDDIYTIVNVRSGRALDVPDASRNPIQIQQFHYFNGDQDHLNQQWRFEFIPGASGPDAAAPNSYKIVSVQSPGLALDLPNGDLHSGNWLQVYFVNVGFNQRWMVRRPTNGGLVEA
jgi:Ricin-type beta-trefoil lectin domain-like